MGKMLRRSATIGLVVVVCYPAPVVTGSHSHWSQVDWSRLEWNVGSGAQFLTHNILAAKLGTIFL